MTLPKIRFLLLAAVLLSPAALFSQTRKLTTKELPPSAFKLVAVKVTGTKRYTQEEILGISGLEIGQKVSEDDFQRTSRVLGETGAFSNVLYSFQYSPDGTKLELQLTDADHFVPARFDNFVWFSEKDLMREVQSRVPLFDGQLPSTGNLADLISDALQAMLIEAGVPGRVDYVRSAKNEGPIDAVVFSVTGITVEVRNVDFAGAGPAELPLLQAAAKPVRGQEYHRSVLRVQADKDFLPVYMARGYLKASVGDPEAKVVAHDGQTAQVDVTFPVNAGTQYNLSAVEWAGNSILNTEKLKPLVHLQIGQPVNAVALSSDLTEVQNLYGTRGYMAAAVKSTPELDDSAGTVRYRLEVQEGEPYKMGDLEITGLDSRTVNALVDRWKLRGGELYDSSYPKRFLESANDVLAIAEWSVSIHTSLDQKDKTVDVALRFDPRTSH